MERRFVTTSVGIETRDDQKPMIVGYGAVFFRDDDPGTEYELFPSPNRLVERISQNAFHRAIQERDDARGLFNHDPRLILGRLSANTLRLSVDDKGLRYEIDVPDTQAGRDTLISIERGDVDGSSFAFTANKVSYETSDIGDVRTLEDVTLYDVGPVTYPAYGSTSAYLRSLEFVEDDLLSEWHAWKKRQSDLKQSVRVRLRLLELQNHGT